MKAEIRITEHLLKKIQTLIFSRYPKFEWATFFKFGFRIGKDISGEKIIIITIVDIIAPDEGDLNSNVGHVELQSAYILRAALTIEKTPLCVGVVHSHPQGYRVMPSFIDDDMDSYFPIYFSDFTKNACYCSLIFALDSQNKFTFSGRGNFKNESFNVTKITIISPRAINIEGALQELPLTHYTERVKDVYGAEAQKRLYNSTVTIVGCGGTGSAVAHILARAGIQKFILIDFDRLEDSNLEKLHGSILAHMEMNPRPYKVGVVKDLILSINPNAEVVSIVGNILQDLAKDYAISSDLVFCCTDSSHSRVGVSEMAYRYLIPAIDIGVQLEGNTEGKVTAEVVQHTIYTQDLPCCYCRGLVDKWRLSVELMSEEEKAKRKQESKEAAERGDNANNYWKDVPALHSVGHLTTLAASIASSYGIGWITNKFNSSSSFFQINLVDEEFGYVGVEMDKRSQCPCNRIVGYADQGSVFTVISAPSHWPNPKVLD
jgi:hypothetical protein